MSLNKWDNNEFCREYRNNYYHENLKEIYGNKILCPACNRKVNISSFRRHQQTKIHNINSLSKEERNLQKVNKIIKNLTA
jgi:translation initiation factor IF-2